MDFIPNAQGPGRVLPMPNIVDDFTRECLAIEVATSLPGLRVIRVLERGKQEAVVEDKRPSHVS